MTDRDLTHRITDYLSGGGLFNPEMANHEAVRDLLIDCRDALAQPEQEPKLTNAGADTNITRGLEPKGSGMVTLNQPEQESDCGEAGHDEGRCGNFHCITNPAAPRKPWAGLTEDEMQNLSNQSDLLDMFQNIGWYSAPRTGFDKHSRSLIRAIEAKLKEKNV